MDFSKHFPDTLQLETSRVKLRLMVITDFDQFFPLAQTPAIWKYFTKDLSSADELYRWIEDALSDKQRGKRFPFAIIDKQSGLVCGSTSVGNISFYDKRIEIGWSWLGERYLGTGINTEAKFLLLRYLFEELAFERVEIKTDNLNERAKKALEKIGATPEGVLRSHMLMFGNRRRDSIYYSILQREWPAIRRSKFSALPANK